VGIADDRDRSRREIGGVDISELNAALGDPALDSMNFLNEVAARFPQAVSFASGRPCEDFFAFDDIERCLRRYREFLIADRGYSEAQVVNTLFQYGRTKGIIHREIARYLHTDEGIVVDPESIVVTVGAQEGMYLVARALCRDERDAALVVSPAYVGFIGAAKLAGMPVLPVAGGPRGIDLEDLRRQVGEARRRGLRPRCVYLVPDFSNPNGICMDLALRHELLRAAAEEDLLIVEDNPYGTFPVGEERLPTLKALDPDRRVVYLGSFAKTVLPGVRVGFAVADQPVTVAGRPPRGRAGQAQEHAYRQHAVAEPGGGGGQAAGVRFQPAARQYARGGPLPSEHGLDAARPARPVPRRGRPGPVERASRRVLPCPDGALPHR
jgi:(S)-3,5-dihydroxyphenylglycine transaminase